MTVATLDQVSIRAREADLAAAARHIARVLLTALAAALFALGWLAARTVTAVTSAALWCAAAVALGWREARPRPRAG